MDNDNRPRPDLVALRRARPAVPRVSIVVPAKNEARNLEIVLPELPDVHEVILVDGASTDDTIQTALRVMPSIKVLSQTRKGKGNALAVGFEAATGDIIVMFDADGSADPKEIPAFIQALVAGADFAKGSRNLVSGGSEDITGIRNLGNLTLVQIANVLFGTRYTDLCYGYNAFWADILHTLSLPPTQVESHMAADRMLWGDGFEIETLLNCRVAAVGLKVSEVPSVELERVHGRSNLNARTDGFRVLRTLLAERRRATQARRPASGSSVRAGFQWNFGATVADPERGSVRVLGSKRGDRPVALTEIDLRDRRHGDSPDGILEIVDVRSEQRRAAAGE